MVVTRDINELNPYVKKQVERWIAACNLIGLYPKLSETYRAPERQAELYKQGLTTIKTLGAHSFRVAVDFYFNEKPTIYPLDKMKRAAQIAKNIGFEWGGDWTSFKDVPHLQMLGGVSLAQYRQGKRPVWYNEPMEDDMTQDQFNKMMDEYNRQTAQKQASDWAVDVWKEYTNNKIVDGTAPQGNLTREQLTTILYRLGVK